MLGLRPPKLLLLGLCLPLLSCNGPKKPNPDASVAKTIKKKIREKVQENLPKAEVIAPNISEFDGQEKRWELKGEKITSNPAERVVAFQSVAVEFFNKGITTYSVHSPEANYDTQTRILTLLGPLEADYPTEKVKFRAPSIRFQSKDKVLRADGRITLKGPIGTISGEGLQADIRGKTITLTKKVVIDLDLTQIEKTPKIGSTPVSTQN